MPTYFGSILQAVHQLDAGRTSVLIVLTRAGQTATSSAVGPGEGLRGLRRAVGAVSRARPNSKHTLRSPHAHLGF